MRIDDGFSTTYEFAEAPTIKFWEKSATPPGIDGGGENDTTTMRNATWRTKAPKKLKTLTESSVTVAYDPEVLSDIVAMCQVNQLITLNFPDGSKWQFWGWLDKFEPGEIVEGEQPEAEVTIIPSNQNASGVETAPVFVPAP